MNKTNFYDSILNPLVTEKSTTMSEMSKFSFNVKTSADKRSVKKCIEKINTLNTKSRKIFIEVSGSITLKNINRYNIKGVHGISIGALTHQIQSKDIGLDFHNQETQ